jgi:hypothetical protein
MSRRDENVSAGVLVALYAFVVLLALLGALFLPPRLISTLFSSKPVMLAVLVAAVVGLPILMRLAHRSRIQDAIEEQGGRLLRLRRLPWWQQTWWSADGYKWWRDVKYEVEFLDLLGAPHHTICYSSFMRGVRWEKEWPGRI